MTARFVKLDTKLIAAFDAVLAPEVVTYATGTGAALSMLSSRRGLSGVLTAILRALVSGPSAGPLVEGNLTRKAMRLPWLYGNPVVRGVYGAIKRFEAALLRDALEAELTGRDDLAIIYNGSNYPESVLKDVSGRLGMRRVFIENGFFPRTMQFDPVGLNGGNSMPRDPGFYLDTEADFAAEGLPQAVNNRAAKKAGMEEVPLEPGFVFVPFQVPSDMQVTLHSPWIRDMSQFLDAIIAAAERNPDEVFVIKEHPSYKRSVKGTRPAHPRVIFANGNVTSEMIGQARAVITLNSTVGIEALLLDKPVITLGRACYNIEGLVQHAPDPEALDRALAVTRDWRPDPRLRRQVIGWLWNRYLVQGPKNEPPADLGARILARVGGPEAIRALPPR
ncbi:nitrogen fixation protein FixF [Pseudooceanicola nanhaiensis]|uniref:capsular polysaccharide export protein, LipB/KpsS family n=1 Tax=Pseudooceanicola nanhaiensis TaxID=375761 RepID=UPI001CD6CBB5|nr:nitrogen fixation protein FixF [Pseudooceanicola nanhaiensis]MCA0921463.1 nitrogen fixation protein FixF [Pseudooceanicola nanhaiensis]